MSRAGRGWRVAGWGLGGSLLLGALALGGLCLTSGCASVGYLGQAAAGHVGVLARSRPVDALIADGSLDEGLRERLRLSQRIRDYAVSELHLPQNGSYRRYADLQRPAPVWNVVAAPALSLSPRTWCFPVVGCIGYRGYYALADAEAAARPLREEGLDVQVYPVPAYSTLGWSNLAGGDPLLASFIQWPEGELARLMFHELAHQVVYVPGDTAFNESFATAVERLGVARWLAARADAPTREAQARADARRADFLALTRHTRERLQALYAGPGRDEDKQAGKQALLAGMRSEYAAIKVQRWQGFAGYDRWMAEANNASLSLQAAYDGQVPAFEALFHAQGDDFARFYVAVGQLARQAPAQRQAALAALAEGQVPGAPAPAVSWP